MNESDFTRQILQALKGDSLTLKLADRFTAGVPDMWHIRRGLQTWLELKAIDVDENPFSRVAKDKAQLQTAYRMQRHGARVYYVIAIGKVITVWHPEYLIRRIITDLNFQWAWDLPIECLSDAPFKVLENFVKCQPMDPILFKASWQDALSCLNNLVETK